MGDEAPLLVVGLGNPGARYRDTRHNIGFLVLAELAHRLGWSFRDGAGPWREAGAPGDAGPFALLQPLTYMNLSGQAVAGWAAGRGWSLAPPPPPSAPEPGPDGTGPQDPPLPPPPPAWQPAWRPLVVCDDLALPLGTLRLRARGSSGGQKGLASIIEALGHDDFPRLRLGIAPVGRTVPPAQWPDFVLAPFAPYEQPAVADLVSRAADAVAACRDLGVEAAASRHNHR